MSFEISSDTAATITPSILSRNAALSVGHRRMMCLIVALPVVGTVAALWLACTRGVTILPLVVLFVMYMLTGLGIEFGFHRSLSHRSVKSNKAIEILFAVLGTMAGQGRLLYWIANHRRHHMYSDTPDDPHSPHVKGGSGNEQPLGMLAGIWHAHVGWVFSDQFTNCALFAKDILKKPHLMLIDRLFLPITVIGLVIPAAVVGLANGTWSGALDGLLWGGFVRILLINQCTWSVASICHRFGSRPYDTGDNSGNIFFVALLSFGAGWQNNHHAFPNSATTGLRWWQIDITKWLINLLALCGLVSEVRLPIKKQTLREKEK
jgi:stearoyl-CoA desaturase (Delta-9 desaturase)